MLFLNTVQIFESIHFLRCLNGSWLQEMCAQLTNHAIAQPNLGHAKVRAILRGLKVPFPWT